MIKQSICAVVPVYNAEKTLNALVTRLERALKSFQAYSIVLVDDGSQDNSAALIERLCAEREGVKGVLLDGNFGQQSALLCGLRHVKEDLAVIIDDDLEQNPEDIITLYETLQKGFDVVYGVTQARRKSTFRGIGSLLRDRLFDAVTQKPASVRVSSFRILTRQLLDAVIKADTRFVYISMEIFKHTKNAKSVEVRYMPSARSGYRAVRLVALLVKMYIYYAPKTMLRFLRKKGPCYEIKKVICKGGQA